MSTSSLAAIKRDFGLSDEIPINFEKKENELILHIPLTASKYQENSEIIKKARDLTQQQKEQGWSREDFFNDFMKVREKILKEVRDHYAQN
jgi:hypothetical protein